MSFLLDFAGYESEENDDNKTKNDSIGGDYNNNEQINNKDKENIDSIIIKNIPTIDDNTSNEYINHHQLVEKDQYESTSEIIDIDNKNHMEYNNTDNIGKKTKYIHEIPSISNQDLPNPNTVENVKYYLDVIKLHNFNLINSIRSNKEFDNPYILTEISNHFNIQQSGSNYPLEIFDPNELNSKNFDDFFKKRSINISKQSTIPVNYIKTSNSSNSISNTNTISNTNSTSNTTNNINILLSAITSTSITNNTITNTENKRKSRWG